MTIPTIPRALFDGANLDVEAVNENLRAISRNIKRNQDLRYTTTTFTFFLDGVADTDADVTRTITIVKASSTPFQIIGVQARLCGSAGVTWTFTSPTNTTWEGLSVTTTGATNEIIGSTDEPQPVSTAEDIIVTASGTGTITKGVVVITILADRAQQPTASAFIGYTATILSSTSSTAGSVLDTELTNAAAAVLLDTNAQSDVRVTVHQVRNLASGGSSAIIIPSGSRTGLGGARSLVVNAIAPAGATVTGSIASTPLGTTSKSVAGAGVTVFATNGAVFSAVDANDPATAASDITLTISRGADGGAVAPLCYMFVWWG